MGQSQLERALTLGTLKYRRRLVERAPGPVKGERNALSQPSRPVPYWGDF
jgi:hypothetical protein